MFTPTKQAEEGAPQIYSQTNQSTFKKEQLRMEVNGDVAFQQGEIVEWTPEAWVRVTKKVGRTEQEALLSEKDGLWQLQIKRDAVLVPDTMENQPWVTEVIKSLLPETAAELAEKAADTEDVDELLGILDSVKTVSFDSNKVTILDSIAQKEKLPEAAQLRVAQLAFDDLNFNSDQMTVLLQLIENPALSKRTIKYITSRIDNLSFESDKSQLQSALLQALLN
ncbi:MULTISPECIES: hypothetical protein [unclassified Lentimonas]|uniref:hypothetical protein n=1 Tax=unclassified Lentimonas TaxID=2630993 RepID=UPI001389EDB1|nr:MULTISPECIES: hypothetical protein [unclassified Lentimonas]